MLSLIDLLRAGTVDLEVAAWLAAAISRGTSFLVGALPGGAGKTTVMGALLNFVPADCNLHAADSGATIRAAATRSDGRRDCYICHEIGAGPYYAYLWGREAREFFALPAAGHLIATNLHADTYEQCRDQLCLDNGVADEDFYGCRICAFIHQVGRGWRDARRRLVTIWESDGRSPHRCLWRWEAGSDSFRRLEESRLAKSGDPFVDDIRDLLESMDAEGLCTIDEVRSRFLSFVADRQ